MIFPLYKRQLIIENSVLKTLFIFKAIKESKKIIEYKIAKGVGYFLTMTLLFL